jgi:2-polyprenyl-3-methyl-5-hydroxy-6-metoxy-1,4-benzoquinol methylase
LTQDDNPIEPVRGTADLERPDCPLCGSADRQAELYRFPPYALARCRACRLWYLRPRLAEEAMRRHYADDAYFEGGEAGYTSYQAQESTLRTTFREFLGTLQHRGMTGGRLLEIGCAYGFFLEEARGFFDERTGTDYSRAALARAEGRADRLLLGGLEQLRPGDLYDCIVALHVIEHIYDPVEFLRTLREHLRPGGWIVLATPDMGGFWRPLMRYRWPFFKVPEHVTYFDSKTLPELLRKAGLEGAAGLPYRSAFSLDLIGEKLRVAMPKALRGVEIWMPATTIAAAGRKM